MTKKNMLFLLFLVLSGCCLAQTGLPNDILIITPDTATGGIAPRKMIATTDGRQFERRDVYRDRQRCTWL